MLDLACGARSKAPGSPDAHAADSDHNDSDPDEDQSEEADYAQDENPDIDGWAGHGRRAMWPDTDMGCNVSLAPCCT